MEGHIHPTQPGNRRPNAGIPAIQPRVPVRPARPPAAPQPKPKPRPTAKPIAPIAPKPPPTIAQPRRTNPPAPLPPRRVTVKPQPPRVPQPPRATVFYQQPTDWGPRNDPTEEQTTQLTTLVPPHDRLPTFTQSLPLVAVSVGLGLSIVFMVVTVAWVIRCISRVNTPEYIQKKAMLLHHQSDSIRLANSKETSKETHRDSMTSSRSKGSSSSACISPATPDECTPLPTPTPSSPAASTVSGSECSAFPGFTPTPSEIQYQWVPMHKYEDIRDEKRGQHAMNDEDHEPADEVYQNAPLNNRSAAKENPLRTIAEELEAQFRKQGVTLFKKHQNQNVKNHEYVNKNAASKRPNTYASCRSETDWVENSIYETGSVANNTKNYEVFYRKPYCDSLGQMCRP